jgi:threonine dehydrogenase-like Zn-dependent dehydrogenase
MGRTAVLLRADCTRERVGSLPFFERLPDQGLHGGYQSSCIHRQPDAPTGAQEAHYALIPLADGTLVATPDLPPEEMIPSLFAASDMLGTGWFGAVAADAGPAKTVAVVGDGAVGLLAAKQLGSERIIAMSRHESRQRLAREFGATDIVTERGEEGAARIKELTGGLGAHSVVEAVGTQESMMQAIRSTRAGGRVGFVGMLHDVEIPGEEFFFSHVHLHGGPAPVRRFLPELVDLISDRKINPGKVFDLTLPLEEVAEGYRAMDESARKREPRRHSSYHAQQAPLPNFRELRKAEVQLPSTHSGE